MTDIDRRALFGAMGAGLLLAGCCPKPKKDDEVAKPTEKPLDEGSCGDAVGTGSGEHALWGDSVNRPRPRGVSTSTPFQPGYVCAAYTRFEPDGIVVRQGHVRLTGTAVGSEAEQNQIAIMLLKELKSPSASPQVNVEFASQNFENFSMNGQQVMVLFIDNPPSLVRFVSDADMPPATATEPKEDYLEHIVRFTQFSGQNIGEEMKKNNAFANLKPIDVSDPALDGPLAYRLDFWNRTLSGDIQANKTDASTHARYSMNVHLKMSAKPVGGAGSTVTFPLVLDPDTGNMGSNP
jgi:hypothetical protein